MSKQNPDLKVRLVSFSLPVVNTENKMNMESFQRNVIDNPKFKTRLSNGLIKGLLTHKGRDLADADRSDCPYDDLIATNPDLCNVMWDVKIEKDSAGYSAYANLDLLDGLPAAELVRTHLKHGMYVGVSMATRSEFDSTNNEYIIKELKGCDMTFDPAFISSGIVAQKNFSKLKDGKEYDINFSTGAEGAIISAELGDSTNFSFRDWLREIKRPKYLLLSGRIRDVIRTLKQMSPEDIVKNRLDILAYVNDIIYNYISIALDSPGRININLGLRLVQFLNDTRAAQIFNTKANQVKMVYQNQKYLTRQNQLVLNDALNTLLESLWMYIATKSGVDFNMIYLNTNNAKLEAVK